jgi:hypothetical protein
MVINIFLVYPFTEKRNALRVSLLGYPTTLKNYFNYLLFIIYYFYKEISSFSATSSNPVMPNKNSYNYKFQITTLPDTLKTFIIVNNCISNSQELEIQYPNVEFIFVEYPYRNLI